MSENRTIGGQVAISDEVIEVIATTAAVEVDGVIGNIPKGFAEFFGKKVQTRCSKVARDENEVVLDMDIVVAFGIKIQIVAAEVQQKVKNAVETMTGLSVPAVNVSVFGVAKEKEEKAEEEE